MDSAEICGKFIKVHVAKPISKIQHGKSAWSAEEWIESNLEGNDDNVEDESGEIQTQEGTQMQI